jgi:hypothetical protein
MASAIKERLRQFVQASGEEGQQTLERGDPTDFACQSSFAAVYAIKHSLCYMSSDRKRHGACSKVTTAVQ